MGRVERPNAGDLQQGILVIEAAFQATVTYPIAEQLESDDVEITKATMAAMICAFDAHRLQRKPQEEGLSR